MGLVQQIARNLPGGARAIDDLVLCEAEPQLFPKYWASQF